MDLLTLAFLGLQAVNAGRLFHLFGYRNIVRAESHPLYQDPNRPPEESGLGGQQVWKDHLGSIHREGDLPAMVWEDGQKRWFKHGELHRIGGPAIIKEKTAYLHREEHWMENGELHREDDKPAFIIIGTNMWDSTREWFRHGKLHRDDGKAASITEVWSKGVLTVRVIKFAHNGLLHRAHGLPALVITTEKTINKVYVVNGKVVRETELDVKSGTLEEIKPYKWHDGTMITRSVERDMNLLAQPTLIGLFAGLM